MGTPLIKRLTSPEDLTAASLGDARTLIIDAVAVPRSDAAEVKCWGWMPPEHPRREIRLLPDADTFQDAPSSDLLDSLPGWDGTLVLEVDGADARAIGWCHAFIMASRGLVSGSKEVQGSFPDTQIMPVAVLTGEHATLLTGAGQCSTGLPVVAWGEIGRAPRGGELLVLEDAHERLTKGLVSYLVNRMAETPESAKAQLLLIAAAFAVHASLCFQSGSDDRRLESTLEDIGPRLVSQLAEVRRRLGSGESGFLCQFRRDFEGRLLFSSLDDLCAESKAAEDGVVWVKSQLTTLTSEALCRIARTFDGTGGAAEPFSGLGPLVLDALMDPRGLPTFDESSDQSRICSLPKNSPGLEILRALDAGLLRQEGMRLSAGYYASRMVARVTPARVLCGEPSGHGAAGTVKMASSEEGDLCAFSLRVGSSRLVVVPRGFDQTLLLRLLIGGEGGGQRDEGATQSPPARPSPSAAPDQPNIFRRTGTGTWEIAFQADGGAVRTFQHRKGLYYMWLLLSYPNLPHNPLDMQQVYDRDRTGLYEYEKKLREFLPNDGGVAGSGSSSSAEVGGYVAEGLSIETTLPKLPVVGTKKEYTVALEELNEVKAEISDLIKRREDQGSLSEEDTARLDTLMDKGAGLRKKLNKISFNGRLRRDPKQPELKARTAVGKCMKNAIEPLKEAKMPNLAKYLFENIKGMTSTSPSYTGSVEFLT